MKTFKQHLLETRGRGTKADVHKNHRDYASWEADAKKLGYTIKHHTGIEIPGRPELQSVTSSAHKVERDDHKQGYETHHAGAPFNRSRGTFWHQGAGYPHGFLRYKYMPEAVINTAQDKAKRKVFQGLDKKIIKPVIEPKKNPLQAKLVQPQQSNVKNMIDALARQPAGMASGIPNGISP